MTTPCPHCNDTRTITLLYSQVPCECADPAIDVTCELIPSSPMLAGSITARDMRPHLTRNPGLRDFGHAIKNIAHCLAGKNGPDPVLDPGRLVKDQFALWAPEYEPNAVEHYRNSVLLMWSAAAMGMPLERAHAMADVLGDEDTCAAEYRPRITWGYPHYLHAEFLRVLK